LNVLPFHPTSEAGLTSTAMVSPNRRESSDNKLLAALPRAHFDRLAPHLIPEVLVQGLALIETGDEFAQVYFPHSGMLSLLVVMRNEEKAIETATVGREGVVGAMTGLGRSESAVRVVVQLPTTVSRITDISEITPSRRSLILIMS
jgi:hypothetical protein